jgi:hypothetical protein
MSELGRQGPPSPDCVDDGMAVELALGLAVGAEREAALTHLAGCPWCRARIDGLREAGDSLLLLVPPAEPPVGFEQAVLGGLRAARPAPLRGSRLAGLRSVAPRVAAAAAILVVALGIGVLVGRAGTDGDVTPAAGLAQVAMVTPAGVDVGTVWRHPGEPSWLFVSVPGWRRWEPEGAPTREYRLQLTLSDGRKVTLDDTFLRPDDGTWASTITADATDVVSVSVVDDSGQVWCTGRFVGTA